jgi:hypothetical protein
MAATSSANEIKLTRVYPAPVKTVWDAWTDTNQVALTEAGIEASDELGSDGKDSKTDLAPDAAEDTAANDARE